MADNAQGFGATTPSDNNSDEIRRLLDQVQELMIEDGADPATAEALTNYARPASPAVAGNLADLNRMGQVIVQGSIDTPPGQPDEQTSNIEDAFKEPPAPAFPASGPELGHIDGEGNPITGPAADSGGDAGSGGLEGMTKAELQAEADSRGVEYSSSDTKSDLIAKLS